MLLPVRTAVLNFLYGVKHADMKEIMEALKSTYGTEGQFTYERFLDHVMSLEANGMIELQKYELDKDGELSLRYRINMDGKGTVEKYVPAKFRVSYAGGAA